MDIDDNDSHLNSEEEIESNADDSELDPVEVEARQMGWRPLEEWQGDKAKWRSASEFVDRASFFKKIEAQNKIIHEQNLALKELAKLQTQIAKNEREKVLKELQSQKREALREQEFDVADKLDEEIIAIKSAPEPTFTVPEVTQVHAEDPQEQLAMFKARNDWFEKDQELTELAETLAGGYVVKAQQEKRNVTPSEIFNYVEKKIKELTRKPKAGADPVMSRNSTRTTSNTGTPKFTPKDLNEEQRQVARQFVRSGVFKNEQEYVDALVKEFGGID